MSNEEFKIFIDSLNKEDLNDLLVRLGKSFDTFANALALGTIPELAPPFNSYNDSNEDIISFLTEFFHSYTKYLESIDEHTWQFVNICMESIVEQQRGQEIEFDLKKESQMLMESIIETLVHYFKGFPSEAFESLEKVFIDRNCHLLELVPQIEYKGSLYRVRKGRGLKERKDLFHTPFELRAKCGSYRYSVLGYPSLYLACSLETALKETRIDHTDYSGSRFYPNETLRCIDLALPDRDLSFWERYCLVLFYPLIVACGLKVKNEKDPFKPEYVVPQILFQVARLHSNLYGISYVSTRGEVIDFRKMEQRNFVLYVPFAEQERGYSKKLANVLQSTIPTSPSLGESTIDVEKRMHTLNLSTIDI